MVVAPIDVVNRALMMVNEEPVTSLDDPRKAAVAAKLFLEGERLALLRRYVWQAARASAELSPLAQAPPPPWKYQHPLPSDFLLLVGVHTAVPGTYQRFIHEVEYEIANGRLLTTVSPVRVTYIRDVLPNDPLFVKALSLGIAAQLARALNNDEGRAQGLLQEAEFVLREAKRSQSIELEPVRFGSRRFAIGLREDPDSVLPRYVGLP